MRSRRALVLVALGVLLAGRARAESPNVRFEDGRLWVRSRAVAAPELFGAVATATGVRFVIDKELKPGAVTIDLQGMDLERAIRNLVAAIPEVAGHTMSYAKSADGAARLTEVAIFGPGRAPAGSTVYEGSSLAGPVGVPTPDLEERMERMIEAGVPRETAEKVLELTAEVQRLQATPAPGSYSPEDLSAATREQLQPLLDRGVPMERAVQMLLLQERYQETLKELSDLQGKLPAGLSGSAVGVPSERSAADPDPGE